MILLNWLINNQVHGTCMHQYMLHGSSKSLKPVILNNWPTNFLEFLALHMLMDQKHLINKNQWPAWSWQASHGSLWATYWERKFVGQLLRIVGLGNIEVKCATKSLKGQEASNISMSIGYESKLISNTKSDYNNNIIPLVLSIILYYMRCQS